MQTAPSASSATFNHVYDATNRRVSQTATDNGYWSYPPATASTVSYTTNNLDQYSAVGSVTPTYDGNGNLTFDGIFTYGYDAENRLISASGAGNTASYAYDAQGRRKSKTVNGTTTIFVQDPQGRALLDYDGTSGALRNWYAFGSGPNDVLNQINVAGSTRATYVPDVQGSIVASLDAGTGTLTKAGYQAYGESSVTSGTFRYTGARIDAETNGLYDFRARMYSPTLGRFMQTDPMGYSGGVNLYAYVGNDPLNFSDPFGLSSDIPPGAVASEASPAPTTVASEAPPAPATSTIAPNSSITPAPVQLAAMLPGTSATGSGTENSAAIQLAAMDESMKVFGHQPLGEGGGGGANEIPGPPASSFSGSLSNPLQAPLGPPRNLPGEFNGQPFSGHAFDQLQNRGIPPSVIDQAIRNGIPNPGITPGTTRFFDPTNNLSVVRDNATGNIITIRPGN